MVIIIMFKISNKCINFITKMMKNWKVELSGGGKTLSDVKIQRDILQGYTFSTLLFVIEMMLLNYSENAQEATDLQHHCKS